MQRDQDPIRNVVEDFGAQCVRVINLTRYSTNKFLFFPCSNYDLISNSIVYSLMTILWSSDGIHI